MVLRDETLETREILVELAEDFRRKCNILYAFIRSEGRPGVRDKGKGGGGGGGRDKAADPSMKRLVPALQGACS
jgi:hypothetical protein